MLGRALPSNQPFSPSSWPHFFFSILLHVPAFWPSPNGEISFLLPEARENAVATYPYEGIASCHVLSLPEQVCSHVSPLPQPAPLLLPSAMFQQQCCEATRRGKLWRNPSWLWFASRHTPPAPANTPLDKSLFQVKTQLNDTQWVQQLVMADFEI